VGDCAGRGADLFESTVAENIGAMILGVAIYTQTQRVEWIFFPLVVRALGVIASIVGLLTVRHREGEEPMTALFRGYTVSAVLSAAFMGLVTNWMLGEAWLTLFMAGVVGILASVAAVLVTMYYTEYRFRPVREIAEASQTGVATNIITGLAVGFENTAATSIVIALALLASYGLGRSAADVMQVEAHHAGIFGTAVATMGMLMTAAFVLAMDTFGPIVDNAGGIAEMSNAPEDVRRGTDALDAAGNTTKALTKGYAIISAALAAFLLFSAYLDKARLVQIAQGLTPIESVDLGQVDVFVGALIGAMLVFLFSSLAIRAVGNVAQDIIREVRRQFREIPGLLEGKPGVRADYARCVDITTRGALRAMILPGALAVLTPVVVGFLLKAEAAAGLLMVGTIAGILLATVMNNGGGAWDNAKKYIETGALGGKGSEAHKAAVVGDTIGDPFKDTAGPSLHVLIKLLATITLVFAPLFIG
jgi:K(+)-stimulated pyrophosphate-energized sodium pump